MLKNCAFLLILPLVLVAGEIEMEMSYSRSDLELSTAHGYDVVRLKGCTPTVTLGEPELAMKPVVVLIPPHAVIRNVDIAATEKVTVQGTYTILPVQHPVPYSSTDPLPFVEPNAEVYTSTAEHPGVLAEVTHAGTKGGYRLATITLYPLQYVPKQGELILYTNIKLVVEYDEGRVMPQTVWKKEYEHHREAVRRLVVNPEQVEVWSPLVRECDRSVGSLSGSFDNPEYAIMVADGFESYFEPLREWKTQKGVPTEIFSLNWILTNYSGADEPEQVRNFIIDYHQSHGTFYFLCVGDWDVFPMTMRSNAPSDLYYQDYDDDFYSEVYVGRASIDNETEAQTFVNKVLLYEKEPVDASTGFYDKIFLPAYYVTDGAPLNDTVQVYDPDWWTDCPRYDFLDPLPIQEVSDSINAGVGYINISSHGNYDGWGGGKRSDADALVNTPPLTPIMMGNSCLIGKLDETSGDCYVEHMMNNPNGGTVAFWGNSRLGYGPIRTYGRSPWLCIWFYDQLANAPSDDVNNIGRICAGSKDRAAPYSGDAIVQLCMHELNLFGDPEMPQWTTTPDYLAANHVDTVLVGGAVIDIEVTAGGVPIENAKVCLMAVWDDVYEVGYTNAAGVASILIEPTIVADTIWVTVTAANKVPHSSSILVVPAPGPYVIAKTLEIYDDEGNNNGKVNPAEAIELGVWAMNVGTERAVGVEGCLSESDDYVDLRNDCSRYGNIWAGDSAYSSQNYMFNVANNCPDNHMIEFTFTFTDRHHHVWISDRSVRVYAPVLVYDDVTVLNDDNDNGALEPGETADLIVALKNTGHEIAENVKCALFSTSPYITINNPTALYGDIEPGATGENTDYPYSVTVSSDAPYFSEAEFTMYARAGYYQNTVDFTMELGAYVPTDKNERYYAYYSGGQHEHAPVFDWIAIDSTQTEYPGVSLDTNGTTYWPMTITNLPFTFIMHGRQFNYLGISTYGYVVLTTSSTNAQINYPTNTPLPKIGAPRNIIAGVWDSGTVCIPIPEEPGDIYYYYDEPNNRVIVEFFQVYYDEGGNYETFEIILYDPAYHETPTGDGEIVVQYLTEPEWPTFTAGMQGFPRFHGGIGYCYDGVYHDLAVPITDEFAIKYTTYPPIPEATYCENRHGPQSFDDPSTLPVRTLMGVPRPNPFSRNTTIFYQVARATDIDIQVYDAAGRLVRTLAQHRCNPGYYSEAWNGCDNAGRQVSAGVYFVKFKTDTYNHVEKTVLLR